MEEQYRAQALWSISTGCMTRFLDLDAPAETVANLEQVEPPGLEVLIFNRWRERLDDASALFRQAPCPVRTVHGYKRIGGHFGHDDPEERERGRRQFRESVDFAAAVGADYLSIHLWDLPDSDDHLERNLATYHTVRDYAAEREVDVLFEVVPCRSHRPLENMDRVVDDLGSEARFTIDLEFIGWHGPVAEELAPIAAAHGARIVNLHLRDFDGEPFGEERGRRYIRPGHGEIAFKRVAALLAAHPPEDRPRILTLEANYRGPTWARDIREDLTYLQRQFAAAAGPDPAATGSHGL